MPISMDEALRGFAQNTSNIVKNKREQQNSMMDQLLKKAQIAEAGYDIDGDTITQRPDYVSLKQAQARKANLEAEDLEQTMGMKKKFMEGGSLPGTLGSRPLGGGLPEGATTYFDPSTGKMKTVVPTPMNEAQRFILSEKQKLASENEQKKKYAQEDAADALKANIQTVQDVKKGSKYFGPAGNVPSLLAPSSIPKALGGQGEWSQRREWEANIDKLKANKVLEVMTQLKQASRTGSTGFGALNQQELQLLKDSASSLQQRDLPSEVAMKHLDTIEKLQRKALGRMGGQQSAEIPTFASESDIPPGFKGSAIVGGVEGTVD